MIKAFFILDSQFLPFPTTNTNMPVRIPRIWIPHPRLGRRYCSLTAPPRPPPIGIANISGPRQIIEIHGRDAAKFLQGLTTRNIPMLSDSRGAYSAFLNAQACTHVKYIRIHINDIREKFSTTSSYTRRTTATAGGLKLKQRTSNPSADLLSEKALH